MSRDVYSLLFSRYGELHGVGDGSTTFGTPDLVDAFPYGGDGSNTGATGGSTTTGAGSAHSHGAGTYTVSAPNATDGGVNFPTFSGASGPQPVSGTSGSESSHTHDALPPYVRLRWILKVM